MKLKVHFGLSEHSFWTGYLLEGKSLGTRSSSATLIAFSVARCTLGIGMRT